MAKQSITKFKWFWAWQDEKEEAWLGEMSRKGYHLSSVVPCVYSFTAGEARDYVYRLDYQPYYKIDRDEYLQLFRDAGWEHIGETGGWQYFRQEAKEGERPEIYSDVESKAAKYRRVLAYLTLIMMPMWAVFIVNLTQRDYPIIPGILIFIMAVILIMSYAMLRLALRIRKLRRL